MAFATIYRDFLSGVMKRLLGEDASDDVASLPSVEDGVSTMRLIEAAVASHDAGAATRLRPATRQAATTAG